MRTQKTRVRISNNEISRLKTFVNCLKSDDEEYLKIKKIVQEEISNVLKDGKVLLQLALAAVIEALRRNPDKYDNLLVNNISSPRTLPAQQSHPLYIEGYRDMILEESDKLYNELIKELVNRIMYSVNPPKTSLSSSSSNLQRLSDSPDTYRKE